MVTLVLSPFIDIYKESTGINWPVENKLTDIHKSEYCNIVLELDM